MKRIITIISAIATLFLVSACTEPLGPSAKKGAYILKLDLRCGELQTRASNGDDNYHENDINFVDYFFFADEAGETPLGIHGRVTLPTEEGLKFDTSEAQYAALQHTSYVYVLANYPGEIDHTGNPDLATLLALPVNKDVYTPADEDNNTPAVMADSFVMDSYDPETKKYTVELKPTTVNEVRRQTITLSRLAVKVTVKMTIDESITTTDTFGNSEIWTPLPDQTEVYFVNSLNNTTVKAEPVSRSLNSNGKYFSYPTNYGYTGSGYVYTTNPAYTYPQTWTMGDNFEPYVKLHMIWRSSVKGESHFYYKIPVASPETTTQNSNTSTTFTLNRNCWHQIQLRVGVLGGTENDYVPLNAEYCVARWEEPSWFSGSGLNSAKYFYVPQTVFHIYGDDHIDIPYYCNADVNAYFTNITYLDYNSNSSGATATRSKPFTGTSNTSVTDYGGADNHTYSLTSDADNKVVKFVHDMTDLYVVRTITLRIANSENTNQVKEVIIHQHPAIELKKAAAGDMFVNGHFALVADARNANGAVFGQTWTYNGQTYYHSYRQRQYQGSWYNDSAYDSYSLNWRGQINGYRWDEEDSYWRANYTYNSNTRVLSESTTTGYVSNTGTNGYGSIMGSSGGNSTVSENYFTTDITVTAFSTTNNTYTIAGEGTVSYKIGDPRVKASSVYSDFSLNPYLSAMNNNGRDQLTTPWSTAGDIMICSPAQNNRNIIAPRILISSGLTELIVGNIPVEFINFVKRGATFQEAGYPAGRWRLPTEGEVAFIAARQFDRTIPDIFNRDVPYYCASGRWVIVPSEGTTLTFGTDINQVIHVWGEDYTISQLLDAKFVYDLWYWGDQPANTTYVTNQYHPNGHVVPYK